MASSAAEVKEHVRSYLYVFAALLVLTVITVAVAMFHLNTALAVTIALFVASIKGSLVACKFMHLTTERGMLYWILALCALFFIVLLLLPILTIEESVHLR